MVWYGVRGSAFHDNSIKENMFVLLITKSRIKKPPTKQKNSCHAHQCSVWKHGNLYAMFLCPFFMSFILSDKYQKIRWRAALDLPILSPLKYSFSKPPTLSSGEAALWLPDSVAPVILLGSLQVFENCVNEQGVAEKREHWPPGNSLDKPTEKNYCL